MANSLPTPHTLSLDRSLAQVASNGVKAVAAGVDHTVILKDDGSVHTVGHNNDGKLGDGSTTDRHTFVQVASNERILGNTRGD